LVFFGYECQYFAWDRSQARRSMLWLVDPPALQSLASIRRCGSAVALKKSAVPARSTFSAFLSRIRSLAHRARGDPWGALALAVLASSAFLCVVNLDYAALWHDEAPTALIGRNLLELGDIVGWDGC